jgi:hypothetical protein
MMVTRDPLNSVLIPIYSQLLSIPGGHLLHLQPKDVPCHGDRGPHNIEGQDILNLNDTVKCSCFQTIKHMKRCVFLYRNISE